MAQALGVADIFTTSQSSKHRLPQQVNESMAAIPPGVGIGKPITSHCAETEGIVEFAIGQQSGIGGDPRTMELKLQTAVEIEPQSTITRIA